MFIYSCNIIEFSIFSNKFKEKESDNAVVTMNTCNNELYVIYFIISSLKGMTSVSSKCRRD